LDQTDFHFRSIFLNLVGILDNREVTVPTDAADFNNFLASLICTDVLETDKPLLFRHSSKKLGGAVLWLDRRWG
jgi:hypothetical protein